MNCIYKDFLNIMVKLILIELENRLLLLKDVKNKNLELWVVYGINLDINLNFIMMSLGIGFM